MFVIKLRLYGIISLGFLAFCGPLYAASSSAPAFAIVGLQSTQDTLTVTISGRLLDGTGTALNDALVTVTALPGKIRKATRTDREGKYRLAFSAGDESYEIVAQKIGFGASEPTIVIANVERQITAPDIILRDFVTTLQDVSIDSRRPQVQAEHLQTIGGNDRDLSIMDRAAFDELTDWLRENSVVTQLPSGGFSIGGADPSQNSVTIGGSTMLGNGIPSLLPIRASLAYAPYDVSSGQFSGGQLRIEPVNLSPEMTRPNRKAAISGTGPWLQLANRSSASTGQPYGSYKFSYYFNQPLIYGKMNVQAAVDITHNRTNASTLFRINSGVAGTMGLSRDSITHLKNVLDSFGLPVSMGSVSSRYSNTAVGYVAFNRVTNDYLVSSLRFNGQLSRSHNNGASIYASQHSLTKASNGSGNVQLSLNWAPPTRLLHSLQSVVGVQRNSSHPYLEIPAGRVRIATSDSDARVVRIGGNPLQKTEAFTKLWETNHSTRWMSRGGKHMRQIATLLRWDKQSSSALLNQLGTFHYQSIDDLRTGNASSFIRSISQSPSQSGSSWNTALAIGDSWRPSMTTRVIYGVRAEGSRIFIGEYDSNTVAKFGRGPKSYQEVHLSPRIGLSWSVDTTGKWGAFQIGTGNFRGVVPLASVIQMKSQRGFPNQSISLQCIDAATPDWDWSDAMGPAVTPPAQCDGSLPSLASVSETRAPDIMRFADKTKAPNTWRSSASWSKTWSSPVPSSEERAKANFRLKYNTSNSLAKLSITDSRGFNQAGFMDLNLVREPYFRLDNEGGRAVFVSSDAISEFTGGVVTSGSRIFSDFNRVLERRSDLRNRHLQLSGTYSTSISSVAPGKRTTRSIAFSYSWTRATEESYANNVDGNPFAKAWSPSSFSNRHTIISSVGFTKAHSKIYSIQLIGRISSGLPFTPLINSDVNGDGSFNDRAFVSPTLINQLGKQSSRITDCLEKQSGRIAGRNSCNGPWSGDIDLHAFATRLNWWKNLFPGNPATFTLTARGLIAATDRVLHGNNPRGWGNNIAVDQNLLTVRSYNAGTREFSYDVNPDFGSSGRTRSMFMQPFALRLAVSISIGNFSYYSGQKVLKLAKSEDRESSLRRIADRLESINPDPISMIIAQSEKLLLTTEQMDSLNQFLVSNSQHRENILSIYSARILALSEGAAPAGDRRDSLAVAAMRESQLEIGKGEAVWMPRIRTLLSPEQLDILPLYEKGKILIPGFRMSF